jgi:hypothetical protein
MILGQFAENQDHSEVNMGDGWKNLTRFCRGDADGDVFVQLDRIVPDL